MIQDVGVEPVLEALASYGYQNVEPYGGALRIDSYEGTLATAETMNRLGERSVGFSTGPIFGHNHASEFAIMYVDEHGDGTSKSAWQILVESTDPDYVNFQLDVGWAVIAGEDPVQLLEDFGDRITSLHIKDVADIGQDDEHQVTVGEGDIDWKAVFAAADNIFPGGYIVEQDFPEDAFSFAEDSFNYLVELCY